jgi:hypothetical protein
LRAQAKERLDQGDVVLDLGHPADGSDDDSPPQTAGEKCPLVFSRPTWPEPRGVDAVVNHSDAPRIHPDILLQPHGQFLIHSDVGSYGWVNSAAQCSVLPAAPIVVSEVTSMLTVNSNPYTSQQSRQLELHRR